MGWQSYPLKKLNYRPAFSERLLLLIVAFMLMFYFILVVVVSVMVDLIPANLITFITIVAVLLWSLYLTG
ncbi:MAG: hypothetical protein M5U10_05580 [Candidatus Methanoperedens sp.]|nr:hypothetical protein [Candidatus Methanoperedens sp.]